MYYFVEPMTEADIAEVQHVERQSFHTLWSPSTYRRELSYPATSHYFVARASTHQPPPRQAPAPAPTPWAAFGLFGLFFASFTAGWLRSGPPSTNGRTNGAYPLVGYAGLWVTFDEGHVTTIAVAPAYRKQGLGELLLNSLIDRAAEAGALSLTLEVRVSNVEAQALYTKYGFTIEGKRKRYYTDNGEDALIMWTPPINNPDYRTRLADLRQQLFARLRAQAEDSPPYLQTSPPMSP